MGAFLDVGLTGGICCGKSTALRLFANSGCFILDADSIYHQLIQVGRPLYDKIVAWLGERILNGRRRIDRVILGEIVFRNGEALDKLNALAHPMVVEEQERRKAEIRKNNERGIVITDAALMIEAGTYPRYDKLIVVYCDPDIQLQRLMARANIGEAEARKRIGSQMPTEEKLKYADYKIINNESLEGLKRQVEDIFDHLALDLREKEKSSV